MAATMNEAVKAFTLSEQEREDAREAGKEIEHFMNGEKCYCLELSCEGEKRVAIKVPAPALSLLASILAEMGNGNAVTALPLPVELTTFEAAAIMGVSRPYLIKLLDEGKIAFRLVGTHRRVRYADLAAYMEAEQEARKAVLDEMTAEAQRLGLYE